MSNELTQLSLCEFTPEKLKLLKDTVCKGATDNELQLFLHVCIRTGLDPFMKQIYSIPRGGQRTIQTSIDGFRLIAERTNRYSPGKEPTYAYDSNGKLVSATSTIKKMTADGSWHEISATAFNEEYNGRNTFWNKMPHLMLAKCAECLALRRAFPAEMSGVYSDDEMQQAKKPDELKEDPIEVDPKLVEQQKEKKQLDFENFAYFFKKEEFSEADRLLVVEYLFAYSDRWKKTAEETIQRFADEDEFLKNFNLWKSKRSSE
jgi:phage recombination protein Bet